MSRFSVLAAAVWVAMLPTPAPAQVAVGPGFVVAPFVRVQWNGHQVHVCAPFVNLTVDWPGCCRCCDCRPACAGTEETYSSPSGYSYDHPTRQQLMQAATRLNQSLEQFQTAESWQRYLAVAPDEALSPEQLASADSQTVDRLVTVLHHFDAANRDEKNRVITRLPDFQQMHTLLANYVAQQSNSQPATAERASVVAASATAPTPATAIRMGWAVDIARMPAADAVQKIMAETIAQPSTMRPAVEELPSPLPKRGI
ncbi:MAG TPA: hypothetical protein VMJ32_08440 [Pirellulales bacterium]|nr:hypothetical protein [Pirellulales bacterium]